MPVDRGPVGHQGCTRHAEGAKGSVPETPRSRAPHGLALSIVDVGFSTLRRLTNSPPVRASGLLGCDRGAFVGRPKNRRTPRMCPRCKSPLWTFSSCGRSPTAVDSVFLRYWVLTGTNLMATRLRSSGWRVRPPGSPQEHRPCGHRGLAVITMPQPWIELLQDLTRDVRDRRVPWEFRSEGEWMTRFDDHPRGTLDVRFQWDPRIRARLGLHQLRRDSEGRCPRAHRRTREARSVAARASARLTSRPSYSAAALRSRTRRICRECSPTAGIGRSARRDTISRWS